MTTPTSTFTSYDAVGNREDLSDIIYNVDPTDTPFITGINREKASNVLHEWQTDALASPSNQAVLEGDDATTDASTATVRLSNTCQIQDKVPRVTGTQQAIVSAGRKDELAYQITKAALELRRDMEVAKLGNVAEVTGDLTTARKMGGIETWLETNVDRGVGGSSGTAGNSTATDGTQRDFTEDQLQTVLEEIWGSGGDPDKILVSGKHKQKFSTFTGNATRQKDAMDRKLVAAIDIYDSDFGELQVQPDRFMAGTTLVSGGSGIRSALVLQMDKWACAYLRSMRMTNLAKTGDSERRQLLVEFTLVSKNEKASGIIADLNFSS